MRVYPLDGTGLTPEQMAVVFAMTSRSPDPFDVTAERVSEERAADFHERWVLDYGHSSVAEHAVLHLAVEGISRLACDELENSRLASYTEKSSRYQVIEPDAYQVPPELEQWPELRGRYCETMQGLFAAYRQALACCMESLAKDRPREAGETQAQHHLGLRRAAMDACRGILPAATLTNVGMTANSRTLEHAVSKLMSHGLTEVQELGKALREQGRRITPTLIKYAGPNPYLLKPAPVPSWGAGEAERMGDGTEATLWHFDAEAVRKLAAALLYRGGRMDYRRALKECAKAGSSEVQDIVREALRGMGPHDQPPREFETVVYTVELAMDYGALREFRRHRMATTLFQPLTVKHGVRVPELLRDTEAAKSFLQATDMAAELHGQMAREYGEEVGQYAVTHAHVQHALWQTNLRELYHVLRLRTSEKAHESIRGPMQRVLEQVAAVHPVLVEPLLA